MRAIMLVSLLFLLLGCSFWPKYATGGFAQHYIFSPYYEDKLNKKDRFYTLYLKLQAINTRLIELSKTKYYRCYPAFFKQFHLLLNKAAQQFAAGFYLSAEKSTDILEQAIDLVGKQNPNKCQPLPNTFQQVFRVNY